MKECPRCLRDLEVEAFNFKSRATGKRQVYCRECSRQYVREHYARNAAYYCAKARARNHDVGKFVREMLLAYLAEHPCVDCGESDVVVLDFDHTDPSTKRLEVALLVRKRHGWKPIKAEIDKCEVRCANCHRRRTARQFGWYRLRNANADRARPERIELPTAGSEDQCSIR